MRNTKSKHGYTDASNAEVTIASRLERWENFTGAPDPASDEDKNRADEAGPTLMFNYFEGKLDAEGVELVERFARQSEDFRFDLIQTGRVLQDQQETQRLLDGRSH